MTRAKVPSGFDERVARIAGARLRYLVGGAGPPLLLVHGLAGAAANWALAAPALARRRRVIAPDLPGHGGSSPLPAASSLSAYADALAALLEREAALPGAIVGHSLGGAIGVRLAARRPDAVSALVLAAAAGISSGGRVQGAVLAALGALRPGRAIAPLRGALARSAALRTAAFWWGVSDPPALSGEALDALLGDYPSHSDVRSAGAALHGDRVLGDLARVRCPALVLWGARDGWVPVEDGLAYARRLGAPLRTIADCAHLLIVERPDAVVAAVEEFLAGCAAAH